MWLRRTCHELRLHVAAIRSTLKVALGGFAGEVSGELRQILERGAARTGELLELIDDLLILSWSREDKINGQEEIVVMGDVLEKVVARNQAEATEKKMTIEMQVPPNFPVLHVNEKCMEHLFGNLVANAIKYSPQGTRVLVEAQKKIDGICVKISDQGIGIPPADINRIFDEFFRAKNAREFAREGTGLGLSIVRSIVAGCKGTIRVESEVGKGTTFQVTIPAPQPTKKTS